MSYFKVMNVVGEVLGYVRGASEAEAVKAAEAGMKYFELAAAYARSAASPLVAMAGLRVVPV